MFDKILAAVDLEPESARAVLEKAEALKNAGGEIWAIHAVEPQYVQYSIDPTFTGALTRSMEEDAVNAARSLMAELCASAGIPEDHQLVIIGRAADRIHEAATDKGVDTIVIGSQARKGLARLLGSTANSVLHASPVNVMTIRIGT